MLMAGRQGLRQSLLACRDGQGMNDLRNYCVAIKVRARGRQFGGNQFQASKRLLKKRPLDSIQVHGLVDVKTHLDNQRCWKDEGRVRYVIWEPVVLLTPSGRSWP